MQICKVLNRRFQGDFLTEKEKKTVNNDVIYDIIEKYNGNGSVDECVGEIKDTLNELVHNGEVQEFKVWSDTDVYDSCGLDIYYIAVTWIGKHGELNICGASLKNY